MFKREDDEYIEKINSKYNEEPAGNSNENVFTDMSASVVPQTSEHTANPRHSLPSS